MTDGVPKRPAAGTLSAIQPSLLSFSRDGERKCLFCEPGHFRRTPQPVDCPAPATFPYPSLLYALSASLQFPPSAIRPLLPPSLPSPLPHPFISPFSFPLCALDRLVLIKLIAMVIHLNGLLSLHCGSGGGGGSSGGRTDAAQWQAGKNLNLQQSYLR